MPDAETLEQLVYNMLTQYMRSKGTVVANEPDRARDYDPMEVTFTPSGDSIVKTRDGELHIVMVHKLT